MGKVLCKMDSQIWYMKVGRPGDDYFTININDRFLADKKNVIDWTKFNIKGYNGYRDNEHHFRTEYYYDVLIPYFAEKWDFPYSTNDFKYEFRKTEYALTVLCRAIPKKDFEFSVEVDGGEPMEGGFDVLNMFDKPELWPEWKPTEFHKQFVGAHKCSRIINKTIDNDKSIFLTGDSHLIPLIPILACYYKEVVCMDNRDGKSHSNYYEGKFFDNVIVELFEGGAKRALEINLQ